MVPSYEENEKIYIFKFNLKESQCMKEFLHFNYDIHILNTFYIMISDIRSLLFITWFFITIFLQKIFFE